MAYKIGLLNAGYEALQSEDGEEGERQELPWTRGTGADRRNLSVGPFYLSRGVYGGMPAALFHAVATCSLQQVGEPVEVSLDEIEMLEGLILKRLAPLRATEQTDAVLLDAWESGQTQPHQQTGEGGGEGEGEEVDVVVVGSSKRRKKKRKRSAPGGSADAAAQVSGSSGSSASGSDGLDEDQCRRYAAMYREGQREVMVESLATLTAMVQGG